MVLNSWLLALLAISDIQAPKSSKDGATFNLLGQKVANDAKGVVIKNGKKFINK